MNCKTRPTILVRPCQKGIDSVVNSNDAGSDNRT